MYIDTDDTPEVTCPYCGYRDEHGHESFSETSNVCNEFECGSCDKIFEVTREYTVSYTSHKTIV